LDSREVFEEIKDNIKNNGAIWSWHAIQRLEARFKYRKRKELISALISNGEVIRFEWQLGYEPRILVYAEISISDEANKIVRSPFHISIVRGKNPIIVTVYNEFNEFEQDYKTRKREYYSRKKNDN